MTTTDTELKEIAALAKKVLRLRNRAAKLAAEADIIEADLLGKTKAAR